MKRMVLALAASALFAGQAGAAVVDAQPHGFKVAASARIAAPPRKVWAALSTPGGWWNGDHSWFGKASNLSLDLKPGGCFCEIAAEGGALHMLVSYVKPGEELRLWGALGPFQTLGAGGGLTIRLEPVDQGTKLSWAYTVGGYVPGGLDKLAPAVDGVLAEQFGRLGRYAQTGSPDVAEAP
ncbi:SRPBCC domain-containing protein [Caulobacter segnis]|uniref:SRPBCC family protein n=1 Tax=Caulobacter segnis TaxID=88688 RepID=UPI00240ECFCA|nr:SRPBCC domain-containing protein [Caulobacter segnis]MDG2521231.1 SRPBCC domain-containing protein [Caulobacter segnis]